MKRFLSVLLVLVPMFAMFALTAKEKAAMESAESLATLVKSGQVVDFIQYMPSSQQQDVTQVFQSFGENIDPEIWAAVQSLLGVAGNVASEKSALLSELILDMRINSKPTAERATKIEPTVKKIAQAVQKLAKNASLDTLKKGDWATVLKDLGGPSTQELSALFGSGMKEYTGKVVGAKEQEDGKIEVTFEQADGDTEDVDFIFKDGKWVPDDFSNGWDETIKEALQGIRKMKVSPAEKQKMLSSVPMIKAALEGMRGAQSKEQIMMMAMMAFMSANPAASDAE